MATQFFTTFFSRHAAQIARMHGVPQYFISWRISIAVPAMLHIACEPLRTYYCATIDRTS
jgi:hypothetical protein